MRIIYACTNLRMYEFTHVRIYACTNLRMFSIAVGKIPQVPKDVCNYLLIQSFLK